MILPITLLAYFLILMDNSIIFTSSVQIGQSLGLKAATLSWISSAYTLTFGGCLLLSGRLSDLLGRKKIFLVGLTVFGLSSLVISLATSAQLVIVMRAVQGLGSSIIAPTTLALIMDNYHGNIRQRAISYYGAMAGIGSSAGLLIGGGLTSLFSWRLGFLINAPITLFLIWLTSKYVKKTNGRKEKIDYVGSLLSILALGGIIYGFTEREILFIIGGLVLLLVFIYFESKLTNPLLPLGLFNDRIRLGAYLTRFLFMMSMLSFWFFLPQMMQKQYGFSPLEAGIAFLPLTIINFIVALWVPRLVGKIGNTKVLLSGEIILALGFILIILANQANGYWQVLFIPMMVIGIGQGLIFAPVTAAGIDSAPLKLAGIASGVTNTMHQLGGAVGLAMIVASTTDFKTELKMILVFTVLGTIMVMLLMRKK
ncbi:MFS transporter [Lactobacillus agilis]|nr:MFS transporter [Ligilactobacillus agilis]